MINKNILKTCHSEGFNEKELNRFRWRTEKIEELQENVEDSMIDILNNPLWRLIYLRKET